MEVKASECEVKLSRQDDEDTRIVMRTRMMMESDRLKEVEDELNRMKEKEGNELERMIGNFYTLSSYTLIIHTK